MTYTSYIEDQRASAERDMGSLKGWCSAGLHKNLGHSPLFTLLSLVLLY